MKIDIHTYIVQGVVISIYQAHSYKKNQALFFSVLSILLSCDWRLFSIVREMKVGIFSLQIHLIIFKNIMKNMTCDIYWKNSIRYESSSQLCRDFPVIYWSIYNCTAIWISRASVNYWITQNGLKRYHYCVFVYIRIVLQIRDFNFICVTINWVMLKKVGSSLKYRSDEILQVTFIDMHVIFCFQVLYGFRVLRFVFVSIKLKISFQTL